MTRQTLTTLERHVLAALAMHASVAAAVLDAWQGPFESAQSARSLSDLAGLGVTEEMTVQKILTELTTNGLVECLPQGYRAGKSTQDTFKRLSLALEAVAFYTASIHRDDTTANVVLTKPPQPSALERQLVQKGWRTADIEATQHAFHGIVRSAKKRVIVMTPFLDIRGSQWLQELFGHVPNEVERVLILRSLEDPSRSDYPLGYQQISKWLLDSGVTVFNYSIPYVGRVGRETFHAKVLLCDDCAAYVGSSNLTAASLEHSMEMGITLIGRAARQVAVILDAVIASSVPWCLSDTSGVVQGPDKLQRDVV